VDRYITLLLRAAHAVLEPLGVEEAWLRLQVLERITLRKVAI
jgi:hypothetical protein